MKRVIFFGAHVMSLKSSVNLLTMDSLIQKITDEHFADGIFYP
jgi:hypothetical protein